jgi:hypothetical protein
MIRTLYHGSPKIVRTPKFGSGGAWNDFGHGFYCTDSPELASQWAVLHGRDGFVNIYKMDDTGIRILDLGKEHLTLNKYRVRRGHTIEVDDITQAYRLGKARAERSGALRTNDI